MMFSVGLPFLVVYAIKRSSFWWALIPGGIMTVLAVIPILTTGVSGEIFGTFVMWVIALPFWVVYLANRRNWWAIIPSGVMVVIGLMPLLSLSRTPFGLVYLLNARDPQMFWAAYPAGVLLAVGISAMAFGQDGWPLVLIALGVVLLIRAGLRRS